jgi:hypothetical protein
MEARVGQLEAERVLPVDASAYGIGGLPIAEMLEELEDRDQGQTLRRQGGLTPGGVEVAEVLVFVERVKLVA